MADVCACESLCTSVYVGCYKITRATAAIPQAPRPLSESGSEQEHQAGKRMGVPGTLAAATWAILKLPRPWQQGPACDVMTLGIMTS